MNEELDSQLSAMFDDELPEAQCELLARRLARDDDLKARWERYAVVGACIRAEHGVRLGGRLARRVNAALVDEPAGNEESPVVAGARRSARWWRPVAGVAVAASVAAVSVLWLRQQSPVTSPAAMLADSAQPVSAVPQRSEPDSYVVPAAVEQSSIVPPAELANYVVAHSEFSTPLNRRNLLSALIASDPGTTPAPSESEEPNEPPKADGNAAK